MPRISFRRDRSGERAGDDAQEIGRLDPLDPRIGTVLAERYRIDALIGVGGMGKVYSAEHVLMKKRLAVKVLHRELTTVPELVARFEREAMAAAAIEHPNVAAATDFGRLKDGSVFLVLEYVQGRGLRDAIAEGPLPVERALTIARQIAAGLASAHAQSIVHRDLKPENVMLVERGGRTDFVKVLDFGIAKVPVSEVPVPESAKDQPISRAGMVFGTPEYMSPEQALGQTVDGRSDLYSLGVILFEMLAGVRPFSSQNAVGILGQQLANPPPRVSERARGIVIPPAVEALVEQLLMRDRERRIASAAEVVASLDAILPPAPAGVVSFTLAEGSHSLHAASRPWEEVALRFESSRPASLTGSEKTKAEDVRASLSSIRMPAVDVLRSLPSRVRKSLRPISKRSLGIAASVFGLIILALLTSIAMRVLRGPRAVPGDTAGIDPPSATGTLPSPPAAEPAAAPTLAPALSAEPPTFAGVGGAGALEALALKGSPDAQLLLRTGEAWLAEKKFKQATAALERALKADPKASQDARATRIAFETAQERVSSAAAFTLLEGPMEARGADVLWDLAADDRVKLSVRQRAGSWLRGPQFRRVASEALLLAADLRTATSCEAALALLPKAKGFGDVRSLPQLEAWKSTSGCGVSKRDDCMPCLRTSSSLSEAISSISARSRAP